MKKKTMIIILIAVLVMAAATVGILKFLSINQKHSLYMIYIPKTVDASDLWCSVVAGADMAAKENEVKLEINAPSEETDIERQNELILDAIEKKPDAIVVSPNSSDANLVALDQVKDAGIKLIYIDSTTSESVQDAIVATDNYEAGKKMGEFIKDKITDSSSIAIVAHVKNSSTAIERELGFRDSIGKRESQIVQVVYSNSNYDLAYSETKKLLENKHIDLLICLNEFSAVGAARAVKEMNLGGKITMVGFDNSTEEIKLLEEGVFSAIVVQRAYSMGYFGIETAVRCIKENMSGINIDSGSLLITKDTMYDVENQEVLFPFYGD